LSCLQSIKLFIFLLSQISTIDEINIEIAT